jgi:protein SCO1
MLKPFGYLALLGGTGLLIGLLWFASFQRNFKAPLPDAIATIENVALIDSHGKLFDITSFNKKITVLNLMFTRCQSVCPLLSAQMLKLQGLMTNFSQFQLISVSIDPKNDRPQTLIKYAAKSEANPLVWRFLTGEMAAIREFVVGSLKLGMPDEPLAHSERFVLIDQNAQIRGYYQLNSKESLIKLQNDTFNLLKILDKNKNISMKD